MDSLTLWARNGAAVRQAIELGKMAHIETASKELTDEFLLLAVDSGLWQSLAGSFPDPRCAPEIALEVILPAHIAARFAGRYAMRTARYVLHSARVLGALGYSVEGVEPERGVSVRGTSDDKLFAKAAARARAGGGKDRLIFLYSNPLAASGGDDGPMSLILGR